MYLDATAPAGLSLGRNNAGRQAYEADVRGGYGVSAGLGMRRQRVQGFQRTGGKLEVLAQRVVDRHLAIQQVEQPVIVWPAAEQVFAGFTLLYVDVTREAVELRLAEMA